MTAEGLRLFAEGIRHQSSLKSLQFWPELYTQYNDMLIGFKENY